MMVRQTLWRAVSVVALAVVFSLPLSAATDSFDFVAPAAAQSDGAVPGEWSGSLSDAEVWRSVRKGITGTINIPDKKAAVLVQSGGESLRAIRNGPVSVIGGWTMLALVVLLALYHALHGPIRIDAGESGRMVERFNFLERFAHWLTASSFVVLALTGLNLLYGRYIVKPLVGPEAFSTLTSLGKYAHNYIGFAFIVGLVLLLVLWVKDNLPEKTDLNWLLVGGGMLTKGVHPPVGRFNVGQKVVFWAVVLLGGSLAATGVCLLFPFEFRPFSAIFAAINVFGAGLPADLSLLQEMQLTLLWHGIAGLILIVVIIGHIYIAALGMEGALGAVGEGKVDENWLHQHHSVYFEKMMRKRVVKNAPPPAE
ncbi:MAG: formate dehydrogenase subunit gamma [Rhodospirillales bacterium]|nr:formate dehydrogenase subunit gamma [Alphaproteobacteria bacterium]MBL6948957.1 formate dehydrogenase subunit gamma [Rhodospirillales bacterium]